ncbi:MAG: type II secretion system protein, partial [Rhodocyclaceae bacterium]
LLIMIMIIGAISAATLTAGSAMQRRAAEEELLFIGRQFQSAFKAYYDASPNGIRPYPPQLSDLLKDPRFPVTRRHLRKIYADPLTGTTDWGTVEAPGGGILGVYSRSAETPIRVSGFGENFAQFEGTKKYSEWVFSADQPHAPIGINGVAPRLSRR